MQMVGQEHGTTHDLVCLVQYLDGQEGAFAEGPGMSTSTNSQRAAMRRKYRLLRPKLAAIDAGVSSGETYSPMTDFQVEFWT
jgi:hypothetical protein